MTRRSRRTILCGTAGLFALSAGCLDEAGLSGDDERDANGDDVDDPGSDGNGDETERQNGDPTSDLVSYDTVSFQHPDPPTDPEARLYVDDEPILDRLDALNLDEAPYTEFVNETPFENAILLSLEAYAPQLDYALELESVALDMENGAKEDESKDPNEDEIADPRLIVEAAVEGTSGSDGAGGTQITAVGQFVRVTFAEESVTDVSVTIIDHEGQAHELGVSSGSDTDWDTDDGSSDT